MRVKVDRYLCVGCGTCEEICPEVFKLGDDGVSKVIGSCDDVDCCEEAADNCPAGAISIEED
ncbi:MULTISPECIES: ferredoxin [unclassified Archaeoglobus]|jgi:ferredoxin|uniref:ferredoxin n=1 Tax=unclassified Archaeoglobus TaxID=2643606 RepID=UPI0025C4B796|nr:MULTISPECIES: ferredoxin [unclassified Archaeoglobus]